MRKLLAWLLILGCVAALTGCASPQAVENPGNDVLPGVEERTEEKMADEAEKQVAYTGNTGDTSAVVRTLAQVSYPEMLQRPELEDYTDPETQELDWDAYGAAQQAWSAGLDAQRDQPEGYADGLWPFFTRSIHQFVSGSGDNAVYSPVNAGLALAMLAEVTEGESRQQLLDLLGAESLDALRQQVDALWNAQYCDDGFLTSLLASSLWLRDDFPYAAETMENLATYGHASAFQGQMGSAEYNQALQDWVNAQTGGMLREQASGLSMDPETVLALVSTIYFKAGWVNTFSEFNTSPALFHLPGETGETVECDFLNRTSSGVLYAGKKFTAVSLELNGGGQMWFLLPQEGVSLDALLEDGETMAFLRQNGDWENRKDCRLHLSIPKFDVSSDLDLIPGLQALGVHDVFDHRIADFSPISTEPLEAELSRAEHAARVAIDENGVVAAAYTALMVYATSMMPVEEEEVYFVLDRPFLFAINSHDGLPLFVGAVNCPVE